MPEKETIHRAQKDAEEGKAPSTQAGEFVREEMHHAESGKHPVKNRKQAVAIGLSKARAAGVNIPAKGKSAAKRVNKKEPRATTRPRSRKSKS